MTADAQRVARSEASRPSSLLEVAGLTVRLRRGTETVHAVEKMSYSLAEGRTLAIVGESGSGKTVSSLALMGLLPPTAQVAGSVRIGGREVLGLPERALRRIRGAEVAMVFQNPARSLNPTMRVGVQICEAIRLHRDVTTREARREAVDLLQTVRIPSASRRFAEYPHELSGGMRQRVMIAIAIASRPKILIADEATTALDVTTEAQIMDLLLSLQDRFGMGLILITHNIALAGSYADDVVVMYAGRVVERAGTAKLLASVRMPYTAALLAAAPDPDVEPHSLVPTVLGRPPDLSRLPKGCAFAPRCEHTQDDCRADAPPLRADASGHAWACFHPVGGSAT